MTKFDNARDILIRNGDKLKGKKRKFEDPLDKRFKIIKDGKVKASFDTVDEALNYSDDNGGCVYHSWMGIFLRRDK